MPEVAIIGAGITGLATAWRLRKEGAGPTVLETADRVGGALRSVRRDGFLAEEGPHTLMANTTVVDDLLDEVPGLDGRIVEARPSAAKRYIVRDGRPRAVPTGPLAAVASPLWSFPAKLRVLREPFVPPAPHETEESVADFVRRRLGDEMYRYAINPLVGGIYAGRPERLSLRHGFPKLHALERDHGGLIRGALAKMRAARRDPGPKPSKRILSFRDGIDTLPRALAESLGDAVRTGVSIHSIRREGARWTLRWTEGGGAAASASFDRLVLAVPAHALPALPVDAALAEDLAPLAAIEYPPVSVVSLGFRRDQVRHPLDGFGALVPECENRRILGALFPSAFLPGRAPEGHVLLAVFVGGDRQPEAATADTAALLRHIRPDLEDLLGVGGDPVFAHHKHWPRAIPQYTLGYGDFLRRMDAIESAHPGLRIAGNHRTGISLSYCLEAALGRPTPR